MTDFQSEKALVRDYYAALDAPNADLPAVMHDYVASDYPWRGFHSFHEQTSGTDVATKF